ncbi:MAG TPA: ABC transporter substrate-binding protein [Candidatus Limnocylindria bacterium]|nr:ABC transporter substrate-binding protein [Candidatus Limnocylindria bacterium]
MKPAAVLTSLMLVLVACTQTEDQDGNGQTSYVFGGPNQALNTQFGNGGDCLFTDPPGCYLHHQASFMAGEAGFFEQNFPDVAVAGETYDFFPMPAIEFNAVETAGDLFGMFNDTPQAASLMRYLVSAEAQAIWPERGGALTANSAVPLDVYPDDTSRRLAEVMVEAETVRFDASDKMPAEMEAAFRSAILEYVQNPGNLDSILSNLETTRESAYAGIEQADPPAASAPPEDDTGLGGEINILAVWADAEQESFEAVIAPWVERTGVTVNYESTRDINATLTTRIEGGNPPDVAGLPGPGAMATFARNGDLFSLENVIDPDAMAEEYNEGWIADGSVDGHLVGIFIKATAKGFIWYNPAEFEERGYEVPEDWDGLVALADQIREDGFTPWGIGLNSGAGSEGWPGTDWIEDFVLRQSGAEVYDAWWQGTHPWNSEEIRMAFEAFGKWAANAETSDSATPSG